MPEIRTSLYDKKALLAPLLLPKEYDDETKRQYTLLLRDILIQNRVFMVVEAYFDKISSEAEFSQIAGYRGFDYIIIARCPHFLPSIGLSRGWTSLDISIIQAKTGITLWHIYSETFLIPEPEKDYVFFKENYKNAPTITQGFISLAMSISKYINSK